ncbi:hypothetical protein GWI33_016154 [Rhynchophorus ferrugineus]|uniref:Uncharacterized protein n=1 Tax=Rhynchophorus ferrugineus TaxID=354439 RepID=A0A834HZA2_RHYFE|nr:hypothetical protein GWI33_016154 [Rhynchophorus ferrugineus]
MFLKLEYTHPEYYRPKCVRPLFNKDAVASCNLNSVKNHIEIDKHVFLTTSLCQEPDHTIPESISKGSRGLILLMLLNDLS